MSNYLKGPFVRENPTTLRNTAFRHPDTGAAVNSATLSSGLIRLEIPSLSDISLWKKGESVVEAIKRGSLKKGTAIATFNGAGIFDRVTGRCGFYSGFTPSDTYTYGTYFALWITEQRWGGKSITETAIRNKEEQEKYYVIMLL